MTQTEHDRRYHRRLAYLSRENRILRARNVCLAHLLTSPTLSPRPSRLIETGWCKHDYARDQNGQPCNPHAEQAVQWSLMGAICRARATGWDLQGLVAKLQSQPEFVGKPSLDQWNNRGQRKQQQVIDVLKKVGL